MQVVEWVYYCKLENSMRAIAESRALAIRPECENWTEEATDE